MSSEERWNCVVMRKRSIFLLAGGYLDKMVSVNIMVNAHTDTKVCSLVCIGTLE